MNSSELKDAFREQMRDTRKPYLWSDPEIWRYMNDAYRMFVRLTGGIPDFDSDQTAVDVVAGEATAALDPSILRVMSARLRSNKRDVAVINSTDLGKVVSVDYGRTTTLTLDDRLGEVRYMMIGAKKNTARWFFIPETNDICDLVVYRLPIGRIDGPDQELAEVDEDHHLHLLNWMSHLAYLKPDSETFDKNGSDRAEAVFRGYCNQVKEEIERYKHKTRVVSYGGL